MGSILLLHNGEPKARFVLSENTTIGRSSACEVHVLNTSLSRKHARITQMDNGFVIEDLGSQNGTFVGGERIDGPTPLTQGVDVQLGSVSFVFDPPVNLLYGSGGDKTVCMLEAAADPPPEVEGLGNGFTLPDGTEMMALFDITCDIASHIRLDQLLPQLLERLMAHFAADRGVILTREASGALVPRAVVTDQGSAAVSRSLIDRAFESKQPLLFHNAVENVSFVGARSVVAHRLRSVMLTPLFSHNQPIGVIQLDSREPNAFTRETLVRLALLAKPAALAIANALTYENEVRKREAASDRSKGSAEIITRHPSMTSLIATAEKAGASPARVLITGESGTGKELIARLVHHASPRSDKPFVALNCGAILETVLESELFGHEKGAFTGAVKKRKGCFVLADGGTLFLDEVAELSPSTQVKLLRALQEGTFYPVGSERPVSADVRVIAATHQDLKARVKENRFREDLYFRLNVIELTVPALRERIEDVEVLMSFFLERFARRMSVPAPRLSSAALTALKRYPWPGNVRELQNVAERLVVLGDGGDIGVSALPSDITARDPAGRVHLGGTLREALTRVEREMISRALEENRGKKAAACRQLGISRPTLDKKLSELDIEWSP